MSDQPNIGHKCFDRLTGVGYPDHEPIVRSHLDSSTHLSNKCERCGAIRNQLGEWQDQRTKDYGEPWKVVDRDGDTLATLAFRDEAIDEANRLREQGIKCTAMVDHG